MAKTKAKSKNAVQVVPAASNAEITNSLTSLVGSLAPFMQFGGANMTISSVDSMFVNSRWYLLSNFRQLLSQVYVENGIVQTLVDQPVDDAFRTGFDVKTGQLDGDEIEALLYYMENSGMLTALKDSKKWARLYGGGAVLLITDQKASVPLRIQDLKEDSPIEYRAVDMWELYYTRMNVQNDYAIMDDSLDMNANDEFFDYYGHQVHRSRVFVQKGKQAPSFIRPRLRGWGMSVLEKVVRSFNQYLKNQDVVFALLDEAKVDVFKMKGFNTALMTATGTEQVSKRLQHANTIKNYQNALTMDKDDDYEQKQVTFAGLSDILVQIRQGLAADLKMPMTKLFGISAAGFNSGEDDIENYNAMLESEIRAPATPQIVELLQIACQIKFGFIPDDLKVIWKPLRILSAEEEEKVKNHKFNRVMSAFQSGLIGPLEAKESLNKDALLPVEVKEDDTVLPPVDGDFTTPEGDGVTA